MSRTYLERETHHVPELDWNRELSERHAHRRRPVAIRSADREIAQAVRDVVHSVRSAEVAIAEEAEPARGKQPKQVRAREQIQMLNRIQIVPARPEQTCRKRSG